MDKKKSWLAVQEEAKEGAVALRCIGHTELKELYCMRHTEWTEHCI